MPTTATVLSRIEFKYSCKVIFFSNCDLFTQNLPLGMREVNRIKPACKPGSVWNDHLSRPVVANRLKPPPKDGRAGHMSYHGVAPDRVYSINMSPCDGWALTPPFHHPLLPCNSSKSISVALVRGLPLAGVTRYPCPAEPGLSSCTCFRTVPAVVRSAHDLTCIRTFSVIYNFLFYLKRDR